MKESEQLKKLMEAISVNEGDKLEAPALVAKRIDQMYNDDVNNVQAISHNSPEPYRAIIHTLLPNGEYIDDHHNDYYHRIIDELEKLWAVEETLEESDSRYALERSRIGDRDTIKIMHRGIVQIEMDEQDFASLVREYDGRR